VLCQRFIRVCRIRDGAVKYHVVFVPKGRRKVLFGQARRHLGEIFHALARQKECKIIEGHLMPDHVHICIEIPPKLSVSMRDRIYQGEKCNRHSQAVVRQREELHG